MRCVNLTEKKHESFSYCSICSLIHRDSLATSLGVLCISTHFPSPLRENTSPRCPISISSLLAAVSFLPRPFPPLPLQPFLTPVSSFSRPDHPRPFRLPRPHPPLPPLSPHASPPLTSDVRPYELKERSEHTLDVSDASSAES